MKQISPLAVTWLIVGYLFSFSSNSAAQRLLPNKDQCNLELLSRYEADFDRVLARKIAEGAAVNKKTKQRLSKLAMRYIDMSAKCFDQLYKNNRLHDGSLSQPIHIDNGGIHMPHSIGSQGIEVGEFRLGGTKWGANSPFSVASTGGQNAAGPGTSGGLVTYSFIPNGVSHQAEVEFGFTSSIDNNLRFSSLPTYSSCFETEIDRAFAMWSAVADIEFQRVSDNGVPSNGSNTTGDIRVGAHSFDGAFGVLAHAFFPTSTAFVSQLTIAGDIHFDRAENWTCDTSGLDIGIVATHEIGHSIGLSHEEQGALAIMNPFYNPNLPALTSDDINGVISIYGASPFVSSPSPGSAELIPIIAYLVNDDDQ